MKELKTVNEKYEDISKSSQIGSLEQELQMV
jgi:hypothetical protein